MWNHSPTRAKTWRPVLSPLSRSRILSSSIGPDGAALEWHYERYRSRSRGVCVTCTPLHTAHILIVVVYISSWKGYISEFTWHLNFTCSLPNKCTILPVYKADSKCCFIFSLHDLKSLQCANAVTPADQKSNPICAFQGALHIFAGHAVALLGTSLPTQSFLIWNSRLPNDLSSLSNLLGSPRQSRSVNCPQRRRMVDPCDRSSSRLRRHGNDLYHLKSLFPPRRMDHKTPPHTNYCGNRVFYRRTIRYIHILRQYISSISSGTGTTNKWFLAKLDVFWRKSLSLSQSNGQNYKSRCLYP
jgi:hypothetical protein